MLSQRRMATECKVSDFNLSNRRAALATETAKQAQQALNDYCVRDLASDIDLARLEMVKAELVATRAELVKEQALRVKGRGPPAQGVLLQERRLHDQGGPHRARGDRQPQRRAPRGA